MFTVTELPMEHENINEHIPLNIILSLIVNEVTSEHCIYDYNEEVKREVTKKYKEIFNSFT
jgi:hypothetical protein